VHSGANRNGDLATDLKTLSQLIGVFFYVIPAPKFC